MTIAAWFQNAWPPGRRRQVAAAYVDVFDTPPGRLILTDLARYCNAQTSSFVPNDPYQTAFNEGGRDAFNHILQLAGLTWADVNKLNDEVSNDQRRYSNTGSADVSAFSRVDAE